jgi:hypothetical protein
MSRFEVRVPNRDGIGAQAESDDAASDLAAGAGTVDLQAVEVDPSWSYGGDESIRVRAMFRPRNAAGRLAELAAGRVGEMFAPYRVEVALEREDGHVLLQAFTDALGMSFRTVTRSVCVEGHGGALDHEVVANFRKEEVLGWSLGAEANRLGTKLRLFARVTALTLAGEVIAKEQREFFVRPLVGGGKSVVSIKEPLPTFADLEAYVNNRKGSLTARALVNLPLSEYGDDGTVVLCSVQGRDGSRVALGNSEVVARQSGLWTKRASGLTQCMVEFEGQLTLGQDGVPLEVEFELISGNQERLELVRQPVKLEGVITDDQDLSEVDHDGAESDAERRERIGSEPGATPRRAGLLGRLRGSLSGWKN